LRFFLPFIPQRTSDIDLQPPDPQFQEKRNFLFEPFFLFRFDRSPFPKNHVIGDLLGEIFLIVSGHHGSFSPYIRVAGRLVFL